MSRTFGDEMKRWRAKHGLTQQTAADHLGISVRTVQDWEQEKSKPGAIGPIRKLMLIYQLNEETRRTG